MFRIKGNQAVSAQTPARSTGPTRYKWRGFGLAGSLSSRLALWNMLAVGLALAVMSVVVHQLVTQRLLTELHSRLNQQATRVEQAASTRFNLHPTEPITSEALTGFMLYTASRLADDFSQEPVYFGLYDKDTGLGLRLPDDTPRPGLDPATLAAARQGGRVLFARQDAAGYSTHLLAFALRDRQGQVIALGQVGQSALAIDRVSLILWAVLALGSLFAAILAYGTSLWLTGRQLLPLTTLTLTMRKLDYARLKERLPDPRLNLPAEIKLLNQAFNQMLERLEASANMQEAFVADVSHELRTPLTSMRGQLEVMLLNPQLDPDASQDLHQVLAEIQRLSRLVANLLADARVEAGVANRVNACHRQPVELDMLLVEVARQAQYLNPAVSLNIAGLEQLCLTGDADLLKQLLLNLLDNALAYTPPGQPVSLELRQISASPGSERAGEAPGDMPAGGEHSWAVLQIQDRGPGIHPADIPHIFERHYRAGNSPVQRPGGAGLGLYIADLIAQAHGGRITVSSQPEQGTCFRIWLPLAPVHAPVVELAAG